MRYMRCKCGKHTATTSMGVPKCAGCEDCNTTLEEHPTHHREPSPHEWEADWVIDRKTGKSTQGQRCRGCQKWRTQPTTENAWKKGHLLHGRAHRRREVGQRHNGVRFVANGKRS